MKQMKIVKKAQAGFTLIELMIVVAIIGILAAVAIPAYQDYIAKSKATAALADITGGKTQYELLATQDGGQDNTKVGLPTSTAACETIAVTANAADGSATGALKCTIKEPGRLGANATIQWNRGTDGLYTCATSVDAKYAPKGCGAGS